MCVDPLRDDAKQDEFHSDGLDCLAKPSSRPGPGIFRAGFTCLRCALPSSDLRDDPVQSAFVARGPEAECATAGLVAQRCAKSAIFEKRSIFGADLY